MHKKILIVEDSRLNARITSDILNKYGYDTEIVYTGEEAVQKACCGQCPDLILMDIELGRGIDGIEAAHMIQRLKDIPIVFLTANASKEIMEKINSVTAYGYVIKSTDKYALLSAVDMALKLHEADSRVKQSEELFRNMFETHKAAMLLIEPESGRIVDANRAACSFYGYPRETLLQMSIDTISTTQKFGETLDENYGSCICVHRLASGEERLVVVYSCPVRYQKSLLIYSIIFDITERQRAENELKLYKHIVENSLNEIYIFHPETAKFIAVNRGARENLGYTEEELKNLTPFDLKPGLDLEGLRELLDPLIKGTQEQIMFTTVHRRKNGSFYPVEVHLQMFEYSGEKVCVALVIDLTERIKMEEELQANEAVLSAIMDSVHDAIIMLDEQGNIIFWNPAAERLFGYSREEALGKDLHRLLVSDEKIYEASEKALRHFLLTGEGNIISKTIEFKAKHKDGHGIDIELSLSALKIKDAWHAVGIVRDISERKKMEEELYWMSITDPLTNTYNRRFFMQMLEREIERTQRTGRSFSVIMLDLDHFKDVNDRFGHAAGDLVLRNLADMVKKRIRKTDILARWGGEEFIILLPETPGEAAASLAEELRRQLSSMTMPEVGHVTASFGVAEYYPSDTVDTVLIRADSMMYEAKASGRNCIKYA